MGKKSVCTLLNVGKDIHYPPPKIQLMVTASKE